MTYIHRNDNLAIKNYGSEEDPAIDDSKDLPEYNSEIEDPSLEDPSFSGDEFVDEESTPGIEDLGNIPQDVAGTRQWLIELRDAGKITAAEYKTYLSQVNRAAGLSGQSREAALTKVTDAIVTKYTEGLSGEGEGSGNLDQLAKDLQAAIDDIDSRKNLTDDEKVELKAPLEKQLTEIKLAKDDPSKVDADSVKADIEEAKTNTDEKDAYSPPLKGLSDFTELTPEEIKLKAENHKPPIDLDKITPPPSPELLNFLTELSPDLKDAFKKVETAVSDRAKSIQDNIKAMNDTSKANHDKDTSSACTTDVSPWQNLFDLKHFQDDKSKAVASAMQDLVKTITPVFEALFKGQEIKTLENNTAAGWEKTQEDYLIADKIQIGGMTIDLVNNSTGKMQGSVARTEQDVEIKFANIWYDGEGAGEWHAPDLQTYGDAQPGHKDNESTTSGVAWGFF